MPEPFKNLFNLKLIHSLSQHLARAAEGHAPFAQREFVQSAGADLERLELKDRSRQITRALNRCLPSDFPTACAILLAALHPDENAPLAAQALQQDGVRGWAIMPMADFVAHSGLHDFDLSMHVLREMTKRFTAEFAVRPFIVDDFPRALTYLKAWAADSNADVRRLASEGSRPRLPWGIRIATLIENPQPILPVLEMLRDDPSEYVRKSVANHLNDIAKDHPHTVVRIAQQWLVDASNPRTKLVRHACRTLIKQGREDVLALFGCQPAIVDSLQFSLSALTVEVGETLDLHLSVRTAYPQLLLVDYIVHFRLANGRLGKKVYKWKMLNSVAGETITVSKSHSFRPITTRRFYSGVHKVELQLNGRIVAEQSFELRVLPEC